MHSMPCGVAWIRVGESESVTERLCDCDVVDGRVTDWSLTGVVRRSRIVPTGVGATSQLLF